MRINLNQIFGAAKALPTTLAIGLLGGCVSMLPHLQLNESTTRQTARGVAEAVTCVSKGMTSASIGYPVAQAVSDLLSVSVYDESLYENTYQQVMAELAQYPQSSLASECAKVTAQGPRAAQVLRERYQGLRASRAQALTGMSQSLANYNPGGHATYSHIPMPSGQVTFGQQTGPSTQHFLVNTGNGQRQCFVTRSGYVNCT